MLFVVLTSLIVSMVSCTTPQKPDLECSGENIVYDPCPKNRMIYCNDLTKPPMYDPNAKCVPRCRCADGYLINDAQKCIPISDCTRCTGPNEFFDCGIPCDRACDNLSVECEMSEHCVERCYCKEGFARDENDVCIPINECKFPPCGDPNAEYLPCRRCVGSCDDLNVSCATACLPGCSCKEGYVRTSRTNDTCIELSKCKPKKCGPNMVYTTCLNQCPAICPGPDGGRLCHMAVLPCRAGCQCKGGYLESNGSCVLPKDCPPFVCNTRPNEVYSRCGERCTQTCASVLGREEPMCTERTECYPTCLCKKGHVRTNEGFRCVPISKCKSCKQENEGYSTCGPACEPTCQQPDRNINCPNLYCVEGCFCKAGYIRHGKKCIKYADCPKTTK